MKLAESLGGSFLADLEPDLISAIRQQAIVHHYRSGDLIVSESEGRWTGIVTSGMARVFLRTEAGRQLTLRHPQRGASIGIAALLGESSVFAQAVTDCAVLELDLEQVGRLARTHPALALAIAKELTVVLTDIEHEVVRREQGSMRQRVAHRLLTVAGGFDGDDALVVPMSHEDLADSVGSAREVVTRHLARFQDEGLVTLDRGLITVLDREGLHDAAARDSSHVAA